MSKFRKKPVEIEALKFTDIDYNPIRLIKALTNLEWVLQNPPDKAEVSAIALLLDHEAAKAKAGLMVVNCIIAYGHEKKRNAALAKAAGGSIQDQYDAIMDTGWAVYRTAMPSPIP